MQNKKEISLWINRGFIALTLTITLSSLLLAFSFSQSIDIGHFFDQTLIKKYRLMNYYYAESCIDQAIINITHDYFYTISAPLNIPYLHCSIESIKIEGGLRKIETKGTLNKIFFTRRAEVEVFDDHIGIIKIE